LADEQQVAGSDPKVGDLHVSVAFIAALQAAILDNEEDVLGALQNPLKEPFDAIDLDLRLSLDFLGLIYVLDALNLTER
jgi:hypothetical protein